MIEISGLQSHCAVNAINEFLRKEVRNIRILRLTVDYMPMKTLTNLEEISNYLSNEINAIDFTLAAEMWKTDQSFFISVDDDKISVGVLLYCEDERQLNPYWEDEGSPSSVRHFKELAISRYFVARDETAINLRFENREGDMSETYISTWKNLLNGVCAS